MSVTVIGDAFIDIIVPAYGIKEGETHHRKIRVKCGGTANVAVWISRLGGKAKFVGKVGDDKFGHYFRENLKKESVEDFLFIDPQNSTGLCISLVSESGERTMIADRGANDNLTREEIEGCIEAIMNSRMVYFSGYSFISEKTKQAILYAMKSCSKRCEVWFNPGAPNIIGAFSRNLISEFVDGLIMNLEEAKAMTRKSEVVKILEDLGRLTSVVVITMGKDGCAVYSSGGYVRVPAQKLDVKDTTGAGDAFAAGFIVGRMRRWNEAECARLANETASRFLKERTEEFK